MVAVLAAGVVFPGTAAAGVWIAPFPLPMPAENPTGYDVAAGPDGTVVLAFTTRTADGKSQVMASVRAPGGAFTPPEPLGAPAGGFPVVAVDGHGTATVVWEQRVGNTALHTIEQSTRPTGGSFSAPQDLSAFTDESRFADIAVNSRGDTLVTWTNRTVSPNFIEAVGRPAGGAFSAHRRISGPDAGSFDAVDSKAAVGADGTGMVVWEREDGFVRATPWSAALNAFGSPMNVTQGQAAGEFGAIPDVAVTPAGDAVFVYFGLVPGGQAIRTKTLTNGVLGAATSVAPLPTNFGGRPTLVADSAGDMLAAWDSHNDASSGRIRAALRLAGSGFGPAEDMSGTLTGVFSPVTAMTAAGDAVVAWVLSAGSSARVQARTRPRNGPFSPIQDDFPVRASTGVAAFADGEGNMGTVSQRDASTLELRAFDNAPPRPIALSLPTDPAEQRAAQFAAAFLDTWSPFSIAWSFGDGGAGSGSPVAHVYGRSGAFTVTATAMDAVGNASSQSAEVAVRALRLDEIDSDRDGFTADKDCDDRNPAIHPGAIEIRGNAVDENCDRIKDPFPRVAASVSLGVLFRPSSTELKTLKVTGLERGDKVKLSCKGRGCRRSLRTTIAIKRKTRTLNLSKRVRGVRLRKRAQLEVRISHRGFVARIFRFTIKRVGDVPLKTELCQPPGTKKPRRC